MPRLRFLLPVAASLLLHGLLARGVRDVDLLPDVSSAPALPAVDDVLMNVGFEDLPEAELAEVAPADEAPPPEAAEPEAPVPQPPSEVPPAPSAPEPVADLPTPTAAPVPAPEPPTAAEKKTHTRVSRSAAPRRPRVAKKNARPRTPQEPCPPAPEGIASVGASYWAVDRDLIDYYATHIAELMKLGAVYTHKDEDGELAGFRVGLPRCSLLREGGLRSGDVVQDINGVRINTVFQAIGAYFKLRDEPTLQVHVERGKRVITLSYDIEQKRRKRDLGQPGDYAAEALLRMQAQDHAAVPRR